MKASINGHIKIVELLLRFGSNPRKKNGSGETALTLACMQGNYLICKRLVIAKANIEQIEDPAKRELIMNADVPT